MICEKGGRNGRGKERRGEWKGKGEGRGNERGGGGEEVKDGEERTGYVVGKVYIYICIREVGEEKRGEERRGEG